MKINGGNIHLLRPAFSLRLCGIITSLTSSICFSESATFVLSRHGGGVITENQIATILVDAALKIHRALGPGLLESVYEATLAYELRKRGLAALTEQKLPVVYEEVKLEAFDRTSSSTTRLLSK